MTIGVDIFRTLALSIAVVTLAGGCNLDPNEAKPPDILASDLSKLPAITRSNADEIVQLGQVDIGQGLSDIAWSPENDLVTAVWTRLQIYEVNSLSSPSYSFPDEGQSLVTYTSGGSTIATDSYDRTIRFWDAETRAELTELRGCFKPVARFAFSPDGRLLATSNLDETVIIWSVEARERLYTLRGHDNKVYEIAVSPDSLLIATSSLDGTTRLWDSQTGVQLAALPISGLVSFSPDSNSLLVSEGLHGRSYSWSIEEILQEGPDPSPMILFQQGGLSNIVYSPEGSLIILGDVDNNVILRDAQHGTIVSVLVGHSDMVSRVSFNNYGTLLASYAGGKDGTIHLWGIPPSE
jgi:WD40 repeat protein